MNKYELINKISKEIVEKVYKKECIKELEEKEKKIKEGFEEILKEFSSNYDLKYGNTVHSGNYFKLESRVKSARSISEKLVRKSEIFNICNRFELDTVEKIEERKEELYEYFIAYEDIIGVKILGEVKEDVKNIYELIIDKQDEFKKINIVFKDIDKQPKPMKNGLEIYNIKGIYEGKYGVEFQIKGKIESAWGDMEHVIFYKNHDYTPLKENTQEIMNRVGNLLNEIDQLLFSIRKSEKGYMGNSDQINFINNIYATFQEEIKALLYSEFNFDLKRHSHFLVYMHKELFGDLNLKEISFNKEFLKDSYDGMNEIQEKYITHRNRLFDLAILESLYCNWYCNLKSIQMNDSNYLCAIGKYIDTYIKYININYFENEIDNEAISKMFLNVNNDEIFINSNKYKDIAQYICYLRDNLSDSELEVDEVLNWAMIEVGRKVFDNLEINCNELLEDYEYVEELKEVFEEFNKNIKGIYNNGKLGEHDYITYYEINKEIINKINHYEEA